MSLSKGLQSQCNQSVLLNGQLLQVAETMYSCIMLALKLLTAFCPEVGPQQMSQIGPGWPSPVVLRALLVHLLQTAFAC